MGTRVRVWADVDVRITGRSKLSLPVFTMPQKDIHVGGAKLYNNSKQRQSQFRFSSKISRFREIKAKGFGTYLIHPVRICDICVLCDQII